jgi:serine/threonine protein phosphatase 1
MFLMNGGRATLASYGAERPALAPQHALSLIPSDHLEFYGQLKSHWLLDRFLCVHAGVNPQKTLAEQSDQEFLWIRDAFIYRPHALPYTVIFGHTPQAAVFYNLPYKVGLDTGLVYGNLLTCLELDEKVLFQIGRGKRDVQRICVGDKWTDAGLT